MSSYFDTPYGALMLDEIEDYEELIHELTEFIDTGGSIGAAIHNRALAYWEIGKVELALVGFDAAISNLPSNFMPAKLKGMLLHKLGHVAEALASLDLAVSIAPDEPTILRTRAQVRVSANMLEEAILDLEGAVKLAPSFKFTIIELEKLKNLSRERKQL
jgi:tetratricopeptide (TPR) repeat protein